MNSLKWIVLPLYLITTSLQAQFNTAVVQNFKGNYADPSGLASAQVWRVGTDNLTNVNFELTREESQMRLVYPGGEHLVENIPVDLLASSQLNIVDVSFVANGGRADFSFDKISGFIDGNSFSSEDLKIACSKTSPYQQELDKYLDACSTNSFLTLKKANIASSKVMQSFAKMMAPLLRQVNVKSSTTIENVRFTVTNNDVSFSLRAAGFNINGRGTIEYSKNGSGRELKLRVDRVRSGIFPVTGLVFDTLEVLNVSGLTVERPYVTFSF